MLLNTTNSIIAYTIIAFVQNITFLFKNNILTVATNIVFCEVFNKKRF